ncbi:MAG: ribonuclease H-like domain-containing protein [Thermococcus sp.]|uniref:DNA polymerase domain-containing protein n=1 Tax=Thermococcus sp. TaxID=35749 RepID=UPI002617B458|nr:DNA polymerase domain-containing protein [Thermococcus sp.]MCD6140680.1 ribonuclease H-like domain-containing protein [Thermococcus sp.]
MILGADYITKDGKPIVRIFKKENGEFKIELDPHFQPYIYALLSEDSAIDEIKQIKGERHGKTVRILDAVKVEKKFLKKPVKVWKLILEHPQDVPAIRNKIREHPAVLDIYEYDIPFAKRYLIDKGLIPMEGEEELKMLAFDIETFYHEGDEFGKGEIIMISYADEEGAGVITWKNIDLPYVDVVSNEREMVKRFIQIIKEKDPDVIITYNGDNFDLPYLIKRAEKLGLRLILSRDKENPVPKIQRMGNSFAVEIKGRIHFDLFPVVKRAINLPTYTLEAVYEAVLGKHKSKLGAEEIAAIWETGEGLKKLAQYSMEDAKATYELGREFFPMEVELAKLIGQSVWDVSRSSTGNLVEWYMLRVAYERNELAPNRPSNEEYKRRLRTTYLGGYVKEPERGLWGNIAYLDFRCHPADTKVLVKGKGIVNISEVEEGDYILGIDGWQKVRKVWEYYYESELININGLKCTPNHKIPVVTENDRQTMIRDSLARSFLSGKVKSKIITTNLFEKIAEFEKNKPSEEEILKGELSGIILAEGTLLRKDIEYFDSSGGKKRISHQYRVEITIGENEKELLERILYIFDKLFGIKPSVKKKGDTNALKITTAKKAVYLQIEEFLRNIENLYAPAVLRGFFEGDGTVNKIRNTVVATQGTNNKWKIDTVAKLLDSLGIPYSRYEYKYVENGKELTRHILEITGRDGLILFQTVVGFISSEKNESLKKAIEVREMNRLKNNSFYSLSTFEVSSEYYKGKVYDLTLEGNPYYFANGILTHNSLYPSIIVTHNVSPDTLERKGCQNYDVAPIVGYKFCKDFSGFIPSILEDLIETRQKIKKEMKSTIDPIKKKMLDYRQRAVKLLANSYYGYMGYPKARWYSKECAESVTAWGRHYIEMTIREIEEKFGFKVLYADSVTSDTEIIVKRNGRVEFVPIEKLFERVDYRVGEKEYCILESVEALTLDNRGRLVWKKVPYVMRHKAKKKVYRIWIANSWYIDVTEDHSLIVAEDGLKEAKPVEVEGKSLIATKDDLSGVEYIKPRTIEEIPYDGYVYDIEVEETHRFFANGILVHNTDGFYATIPGETPEIIKKKAKEFLNYINSKLPGLLELEYEGFYLRGFFVTKKRYAVIDEEGKITTRGLEVVRRDWSEIAKETQARVLEAILREGSVEKAVEIVKEVVEAITKYKVPLEKLIIHEQITRELRDYKAIGPHVAIAKRLAAKGIKIKPGTIISYIVLRGSGKISDRVVLLTEYDPRKHKYDPDYYIENQVLPAVLRILEAFGYRKEDLKYQSSKQTGLESWLKR